MLKSKKFKKVISFLCITSIFTLVFSGCDKKDNNSTENESTEKEATATDIAEDGEVVMSVAGCEVTKSEAMVYCLMNLLSGQTLYADVEADSESEEAAIINNIAETKKLYVKALDEGVKFEKEDEEARDKLADSFKQVVPEDLRKKYDVSDAVIDKVMTEYSYVQKLEYVKKNSMADDKYEELAKQYADYNFQTLYLMVFPIIEVDENDNMKKDENGNYIYLSEEKKKEAKENLENAIKEVVSGDEPKEVAKKYGVEAYSNSTAGYEGGYDKDVNELVSGLKAGECSRILETDICYYSVCVRTDHDEEYKESYLRELAKSDIDNEYSRQKTEWLNSKENSQNDFLGDFWKDFDVLDMAKLLKDAGLIA